MSANLDAKQAVRLYISDKMTAVKFKRFFNGASEQLFFRQIREAAPIAADQVLRIESINNILQRFFSGEQLSAETAGQLKSACIHNSSGLTNLVRVLQELAAIEQNSKGQMSDITMPGDDIWFERLGLARPGRMQQATVPFSSWLRYPLYALAAAMFIFTAVFIYRSTNNHQDRVLDISFDNSLPADYLGNLERGAETTPRNVPSSFSDAFRQGMAAYLVRDYSGARKHWKGIEAQAEHLLSTQSETPQLVRDYYFYSGLGALAQAVSRAHSVNKTEKKTLLNEAEHKITLAGKNGLASLYYRGLIASLRGHPQQALKMLRQIPGSTPFSSKARALENHLMSKTDR